MVKMHDNELAVLYLYICIYIPACGQNTAEEPLLTATSKALRVSYLAMHVHSPKMSDYH